MIAAFVGELVLGWLLADFVTGLFHWWEDSFGSPEWPIIGSWLIAPNRLHHTEPLAFTRHGFWDRNGASIIAAAATGALWSWFVGPSVLMLAFLLGGGITNEVHRYAHQPSARGPFIRMLQQTGAWQSPKAHAVHHRPPHDRSYCVLTDWLNPLLELMGFWATLNRLFGNGEANMIEHPTTDWPTKVVAALCAIPLAIFVIGLLLAALR